VGTVPDAMRDTTHARVQEGVAKSQFPLKDNGFQKWKSSNETLLNEFTPSNTLVWTGRRIVM